MHLSDIILLGDPRLYQKCEAIKQEELDSLLPIVEGMAKAVENVDIPKVLMLSWMRYHTWSLKQKSDTPIFLSFFTVIVWEVTYC